MWQVLGWLGWILILLCFFPKEWLPKLRQDTTYQHFVYSSIGAVTLLWCLQAGVVEGLAIHFLLVTALTLCHGFRIAMWMTIVPTLSMAVFKGVSWQDIGLYGLCYGVIPCVFSEMVYQLTRRYLAHHLFIYLFVAAFFNGALMMVVTMLAVSGWQYVVHDMAFAVIWYNYLSFMPVLLFPEALLNGMVMTLLVIYRSHWVRSFSEQDYYS
ncbi:energy-coupling factor ABC transporter permease [Thaumasiovibrio subtropicus]|uniref:energy-coupling factor ABC transporter permease n=1 Tax=Thaumasiovibrio subtropicus TaxID=1891207 RepID=UPI000B34CAFF|nr:energy-coupling factor ABC transporter permease [Thaumasiovibrio subtropicus]